MAVRRTKKNQKAAALTAILKTLLEEDIGGGLARPLDLLFECNSLAVLEQVALEEAQASSSSKLCARRQARSTRGFVTSAFSAGSTNFAQFWVCLLYTSPSPRDLSTSRMPSSA